MYRECLSPVLAIHGDKDKYGSRAFAKFIKGKTGGIPEMHILQDMRTFAS